MSFKFVPQVCPACNHPLEWKNHDLYCVNPNCSNVHSSGLYQWISVVGLRDFKGVGPSLLDAIIYYFGWSSVEDVYSSPVEEQDFIKLLSVDGIGESKVELVRQVIDNLTKISMPFSVFLTGLNLKGLSSKIALTLEQKSNLETCIQENTRQFLNITEIKGLGESIKQTILSNWDYICKIYNITADLHIKQTKPAETQESSSKLKVCITGKANDGLTRTQFYKKYKEHIQEASVASCDYLVCNAPSNSSKIKTAKAKGIKVIAEEELIELF